MYDPRWDELRERDDGRARVYDERDRDDHDPRDGLMHDLDLPRGDERELVVDRDRVYELDREDSRALAAVGAFRVVPEHDFDLPHDTLESLQCQRLVELVDLGDSERGLTLTTEGRDLLDSHLLERDREPSQMFYAGVSRSREIDVRSIFMWVAIGLRPRFMSASGWKARAGKAKGPRWMKHPTRALKAIRRCTSAAGGSGECAPIVDASRAVGYREPT